MSEQNKTEAQEYWEKCAKGIKTESQLNDGVESYKCVAHKHGLPTKLIDVVIRDWGQSQHGMSFWAEIAKKTTPEFWQAASSAIEKDAGQAGYLMDLLWLIGKKGRDVFDDDITASQKKRKAKIIRAIQDLGTLLRAQRTTDTHSTQDRFIADEYSLINMVSHSSKPKVRQHGHVIMDHVRNGGGLSSPTVAELLECLELSVQSDYRGADMVLTRDKGSRPRYEKKVLAIANAELRWCIQQIIEWFYRLGAEAPKAELMNLVESLDPDVGINADSLYIVAQGSARKNIGNP